MGPEGAKERLEGGFFSQVDIELFCKMLRETVA